MHRLRDAVHKRHQTGPNDYARKEQEQRHEGSDGKAAGEDETTDERKRDARKTPIAGVAPTQSSSRDGEHRQGQESQPKQAALQRSGDCSQSDSGASGQGRNPARAGGCEKEEGPEL